MGFSTLGNEINGGIREIKGFDGVFVDERRVKDMRKKGGRGEGKGGGCSNTLIRIFMVYQRQRGERVCRTNGSFGLVPTDFKYQQFSGLNLFLEGCKEHLATNCYN